MTRILVVEDDNDINALLCRIITQSNYEAQPAFSGTEALLYLKQEQWDLILLDLMLPGLEGTELLQKIRDTYRTPVIIISAKGESETIVALLRAGADDYITKPFDITEVGARIDAVLRRYNDWQAIRKTKLQHKDIVLDLDTKTVKVNNKEVVLTSREFQILKLLMSQPQKIFSKENVYESVWKERYYGDDNTINVHMSNLRNKLQEANPNEEYIETIWGIGYRMKA